MEEFSEMERSVIRNMMLNRSHKAIAGLLERPVDEICVYINGLVEVTGITTHQMKLDDNKVRQKSERKATRPKVKVVKDEVKKAQEEKQLQREAIKRHRLNLEEAGRMNRQSRREPKFDTRSVDYSKMKSIRIDRNTIIYCGPGEDPEKKKADFLKTYQKPIDRIG